MMLNFNLERIFILQEKGKFPKRSVWINFDDMDETIYENAYPILKNIKIPATGFIITGSCWGRKLSQPRYD